MMTGVERAQGLAAAADSQAQEVALRAAGAGFVAVAAGVARVRNAITSVQDGLGGLAGAIGEATNTAAAVPNEASPQETIAGLAPVRSSVDAARDAAAGAITQIGEAQQIVVMVLQGGQPGPLLQALDGIKQVLVLLVQRTGGARQAVEEAIAEARQLGSSGNRRGLAVIHRPALPLSITVIRLRHFMLLATKLSLTTTTARRGPGSRPVSWAGHRPAREPESHPGWTTTGGVRWSSRTNAPI